MNTEEPSLAAARRFFAAEIEAVAHLRSAALVEALATVPRERFLGPGPWQIMSGDGGLGPASYWTTADADPRRLCHNVVVALDPARQLNNGQPSLLASWIDALELAAGERAVHVGCGVGYFTALIARVVGADGRVTGVEIDAGLAARARANLAELPQAEVVAADAATYDPGEVDALLVNAGVTHPLPIWLDRLRPGGRLLLPLTFTMAPSPHGKGLVLLVRRQGAGWSARFLTPVAIYPCLGCRDENLNLRLREALGKGDWFSAQSLRRDPHEPDASCWLHGDGFCISKAPPPAE
jgi:protein-L-isoaspartate(D-aspartate) O-methyltransferase